MNLEKLNRWLVLAANLGVIGGIVFLAVEIKQNTDMMQAQTRSNVTESILTLLEMERHPHVVSAYKKRRAGQELNFEEEYFLSNMANATFRQWENSFYQNRAGLFESDQYAAEIQVGRDMMHEEHMAEYWSRYQQDYSEPFQIHVNEILIQSSQVD